ncbi:MAG: inorganic phosphate transporter [Micrococcaceae bacterium]
MTDTLLTISILLLGIFTFSNGMHDASNTIAAAVKTRALTPGIAIRVTAGFALIGALVGGFMLPYATLGFNRHWIALPSGNAGPIILISMFIAGILWNLLTLLLRMPSSSFHALVGGLIGALWATTLVGQESPKVDTKAVFFQIILPLILIPPISFVIALIASMAFAWFLQDAQQYSTNRKLRMTQSIATSAFALTHGIATIQRLIFLGYLGFKSTGKSTVYDSLPITLVLLLAIIFGLGSLSGGWRITHTLSNNLVPLDPLKGTIAQSLPALLYVIAAFMLFPVSSTHVFTNTLVGAGAVPRWKAVNTDIVLKMLGTWILTPLFTGGVSALLYLAFSNVLIS